MSVRHRSLAGPVRAIHVQVDEELYLRLDRYCDVASLTKTNVISRGITRMLKEATKLWPPEYLQPEVVTSLTDSAF